MTKSKDLRDVVIAHYHNDKNAPEMSTILANKMHCVTVHWQFNHSGSVNERKSSRRRLTGRTKSLVNLVKTRVRSQSARKSSRTMATDFVLVLFF